MPVPRAVISHAHGDHAVPGNQNVHCTAPTADIMELRYKKNAGANFTSHPYNHPFEINGVQISFISAGHILGSAQVLMEYEGIRYLFTGDYKLQSDDTCQAIEFVQADVLVTETTFANPQVQNPDPVGEILKLNASNHNILLGAYSLGKAQRLVSLISEHCPQRKILVHHNILPINKIYEKYDSLPGKYEPYNRKLMKQAQQDYVYMVPPITFDSYFRAKNVLKVFASGWKALQKYNDLELLISDHVDWNDILKMIEQVKPQEIWTRHGDGSYLKAHFEGHLPIKLLNRC